jgi:hypothetical protein
MGETICLLAFNSHPKVIPKLSKIRQLTAVYPAEPCHNRRNNFLVCNAVNAEAGEQIYDKEGKPTNYKNA